MRRPFTALAIALLSLVASVQLLRIILGWQVTVAAALAVLVWMEMRR